MDKIKFKLNEKEIECDAGQTIMEAALANDIFIPALCEHPDFPHKANCRVCVVEIEGRRNLATSCSTRAENGMVVRTDTDKVKKSRNLNIEMLFAEHIEKCATCIWRVNCRLLDLAERYKIIITTFKDRKGSRKTLKFANAIEIDGTQCIDCRNCIDACSKMQKINYLELKAKGIDQEVVVTEDKNAECILCGQCALHCPVGSAQEQSTWEEVEKALKDEKKTVIAQISSSAIVSIGEEFKETAGEELYKHAYTAMRQLGFKYIFDDGLSNMISASKGALEVMSGDRGRTAISSSCPSWVKYVEHYKPELKDRLLKLKSPHIIGGGLVKDFWAKQNKLDPDNIVVVSVLPCTAAKFEIERKEVRSGRKPVDIVITVRELAWLIKKNRIELKKLEQGFIDELALKGIKAPLYSASGGETELVMRVAGYLSGEGKNDKLEQGRDSFYADSGVKEITVQIAGRSIKAAVVNGIGNIGGVMDNLDKYDFLEVLACPGGCTGGGGQAIPTNAKIRTKRLDLLRAMDSVADKGRMESEVLDWLEKNQLENDILCNVK